MSEFKSDMPSSHNREEALFQAASQLSGAERATFLNGTCLGDAALRQRLEALLAAHDAPDDLSPGTKPGAKATMKLEFADAPDEAVGQTLGRYKLMERLGEGGCGVVYVAEQSQPVRRRVALKVIKLGMDTKMVVARFEAERQALAMMDHPNIAKVLDAGTTETGRPFFVMELVRGIRITEYCDKNNLNTKERLHLFISVCHAIQHAHQKGIIHRDIKPSNILVTLHDGVPVPKVIDFGIAKATEGRLTEATVYTQLHQFIGTPAYMSPEQAEMSGLDVDTRSDIYSLGVLLYELLAGSTPFDGKELMSQGIDQMRKTIRESEPPRPSTRFATLEGEELTTTAKRRSADKSKLVSQLKGDIDWIVMKCLEKDRTRRYDTANGLAADLNRHLNNEPVVARPPSAAYKFQKAFRRNKLAFTAGTAIAAALVVGISLSVWQAVRATHATRAAVSARQEAEASEAKAVAAQANEAKLREQAEQSQAREAELRAKAEASAKAAKAEATKSKQVSYFMEDMLKGAGPSAALGRDTTLLREILDKATARASTALKDQPEALAQLLSKIANTYNSLGDYKKYDALTREVYQLRRGLYKSDNPDLADAMLSMGLVGTNYVANEALIREALAMYQRLNGSNNLYVAKANERLASILLSDQIKRYAEAEPVIRGAIAMRAELVGETNTEVAGDYNMLANDLWSLTRTNEALQAIRRSIQLHQASDGVINPRLIYPQLDYGWMLLETGDLKTAESVFREGIVISEKYFASVNREARYKREGAFYGLEQVLVAQGRSSETNAVEVERQQFLARTAAVAPVEIAGDTNAPDISAPAVTVISPDDLAQQGRFAEAVPGFVQLMAKDPSHSKPYLQLAALLLETGDLNGYRQLSHRALNLFQGKPGTTVVRISKLTDYCDQANLTTKERLDLFIKVCQAIQHAHQKGIIHRDIKPSNILVTLHDGVPVPKVIDFGIAKATEGRLTDATVYTQLHQFIGTPAYMSPEQAEMSGLDIDTRSDIYSLGVLLYELLAGSTPFDAKDLMASGIDQMRKTIREQEPVRPSTRFATLKGDDLTTTAKRRSADTSKLMHQLKGDLDWIVMKCLEKDRTRRYETANGLAADLKRHLNHEPVVARPPSTAYRFQKAFRRNKIAFAAGTAVAAALLLGIIASTWQSVRATRAKHEALAAKEQAVQAQAGESVQRQKAEANEQQAVAARANEAKLRSHAEAEELAARQRAYASDMNVAKQALDGNNLGRALDLLNRQRPEPGHRDLRGWEWRYLWQQTHSDAAFTLCQQSSEINSLAVSFDGNWLAVGERHRGGLSVWDLRTRQELIRLAKNESYVRAAFSPTEPLLAFVSFTVSASGQARYALRLWNVATRQMVAELPLDNSCLGLAFAKDGRTLVTSTARGQITLLRMPDGTKLASYPSEQDGVDPGTSFAIAPDLSLAAYGLAGGRIGVMDLRNGKELWRAMASKEYTLSLAFSPDGKTLASGIGFAESAIRLWDVATGKEIGQLEGHGSWVSALVFSPDGKTLTSSSADQTIRIWDVASQKCLDVLRGHRQEVWRLALLPDGKTLVSGGKDGTVCFWDTSVMHPHQPHITLPAENVANWNFAPDGQSILALDKQGQVSQWTGSDFQQRTPLLEMGTNVFQSYFSLDGRFLALCWTNGIIQVWNPSQRVLLHQLTNTPGKVHAGSILADGKKLGTGSESDQLFHEWDLTTGSEIQSWRGPEDFQGAVGISPDERSFVAMGYGGDVVVRNLADQSRTKVELDTLEAVNVGFSPDGKLFAMASDLGYARVWDTAIWKPVATLGGLLNGAHTVNFSPDGKRLAISSDNKEAVKLWDTESWQDVFTLEGQGTGFGGAWFSPDGNALFWGNGVALYLWRAPTWPEINAAETKEKAESKQP